MKEIWGTEKKNIGGKGRKRRTLQDGVQQSDLILGQTFLQGSGQGTLGGGRKINFRLEVGVRRVRDGFDKSWGRPRSERTSEGINVQLPEVEEK